MTPDTSLWLGTENSLLRVLQARHYALNHPEGAKALGGWGEPEHDQDADLPQFESDLIEVHGNVGILKVSGPMVADDSWWNSLFGLVSYPEIARAAMELGQSDQIESVLFLSDSPGGDVSGLETASEALAWLGEQKPLYTHTSGSMMSAAYWLGVEGRRLTSTRMAETGSIGVLIVHRSIYQALKENGVEYTVIRAGKYKALGHPSEQLSDEAKAILQGKADELYSFFLERVSTKRQALSIATKDAWAEGRTFFGPQALQLGLVDELTTLSKRVAALDTSTVDEVDKRLQGSNNATEISLEETVMPKGKTVILQSDKDKAALENGAALDTLNVVEETDGDQAAAAAEAAPGSDTENAQVGADGGAAAEASAAGEENAPAGLVAYLKEQNAALTDQVSTLKAKITEMEGDAAEAQANVEALLPIAGMSLQRMQVALNSAPLDIDGLPVATVVAQHAKVRTQFERTFRVGQQSAAPLTDDDPEEPSAHARKFGIVPKN